MEKVMKAVAETKRIGNNSITGYFQEDDKAAKQILGQITGVKRNKDINERSQFEVTTKSET